MARRRRLRRVGARGAVRWWRGRSRFWKWESRISHEPRAPSPTWCTLQAGLSQLAARSSQLLQVLLEQPQNPLVLVGPTGGLDKPMVLHRVDRQVPVRLAELNESLHQPHGIGEFHVRIHHAVADEQRSLQALREI